MGDDEIDGFKVLRSSGSVVLSRDGRAWAAVPMEEWQSQQADVLSRAKGRHALHAAG